MSLRKSKSEISLKQYLEDFKVREQQECYENYNGDSYYDDLDCFVNYTCKDCDKTLYSHDVCCSDCKKFRDKYGMIASLYIFPSLLLLSALFMLRVMIICRSGDYFVDFVIKQISDNDYKLLVESHRLFFEIVFGIALIVINCEYADRLSKIEEMCKYLYIYIARIFIRIPHDDVEHIVKVLMWRRQ